MTTAEDFKVLIAGAGPAGLALGQILQKNGILCEVFERDSGIDVRGQGWAVALKDALPRVVSKLPKSLGDVHKCSVNVATGLHDTAVVIDAVNNRKLGQVGGHEMSHKDAILRVRREGFREYLARGAPIAWNKQIVDYQEDSNGVVARFKDGTQARGSILVGADGASSHIRSQFLYLQHADPASYQPIVGIVDLTPAELQELQSIGSAVAIACSNDLRFMVGLLSTNADLTAATAYYAVCFRTTEPFETSEWMKHATKEELYKKAMSASGEIDPSLTKFLEKGGPDSVVLPPLLFREFWPPLSLPEGRVTLIGDALHTMMPFRGAGANTALLDACDLSEQIMNLGKDYSRENIVRALRGFAKIACPRGRDVVSATHVAGEDMHLVFAIEKHLLSQ